MPVKLILVLILIILVAILTGFNLSNTCTIWFFHTFTDIPVFAALLTAFILGVIVTLPFTVKKRKQGKKSAEQIDGAENPKKAKKFFFAKKDASKIPAQKVDEKSQKTSENQIKTEPDVSDADYVLKKTDAETSEDKK